MPLITFGIGAPAISALVGALIGGCVSLFTFFATRNRENNNDLREQLIEIADLRYQRETLDMSEHNAVTRSTWMNTKRNIRLAMAMELAEKLQKTMSAWDAMTLGQELDANGDFEAAKRYLHLALVKSRRESVITQASAERFLAAHYFDSNVDGDLTLASRHYEQSVALTSPHTGVVETYTTARTYYLWARRLKGVGSPDWLARAYDAREWYEKLPPGHSWRTTELPLVDELIGAPQADTEITPSRQT